MIPNSQYIYSFVPRPRGRSRGSTLRPRGDSAPPPHPIAAGFGRNGSGGKRSRGPSDEERRASHRIRAASVAGRPSRCRSTSMVGRPSRGRAASSARDPFQTVESNVRVHDVVFATIETWALKNPSRGYQSYTQDRVQRLMELFGAFHAGDMPNDPNLSEYQFGLFRALLSYESDSPMHHPNPQILADDLVHSFFKCNSVPHARGLWTAGDWQYLTGGTAGACHPIILLQTHASLPPKDDSAVMHITSHLRQVSLHILLLLLPLSSACYQLSHMT